MARATEAIVFLSAGFATICMLLGHIEFGLGILFGASVASVVNGINTKSKLEPNTSTKQH